MRKQGKDNTKMMSEVDMLLTEQLTELGFQSYEEAEANGYVAEYGRDEKGEIYARWIKK